MSTISKQLLEIKYLLDLPEDILIKILLLLPVDSVLALKCVSKQLVNLIADPKFFNIYRTTTTAFYLHEGTLYCVLFRHNRPYTVHSLRTSIPVLLDKFDLGHELLSGWSNGVACVKADNGHFIIYNLFTGTSYTVSDAPQQQYEDSLLWLYYGSGYDRYADDYKILVVPRYEASSSDQNEENSLFWVYSIKNRVGKWLDGFPYGAYSYYERTDLFGGAYSFNGVLHLVASTARVNPAVVILTFDLHTCRFGEILLPSGEEIGTCKVAELDGQLCVLHQIDAMEAWVMKDYGVVESWTKLFSFDFLRLKKMPHFIVVRLAYTVLYECGDGTKGVLIVSHDSQDLLWYNITKNTMEVTNTW